MLAIVIPRAIVIVLAIGIAILIRRVRVRAKAKSEPSQPAISDKNDKPSCPATSKPNTTTEAEPKSPVKKGILKEKTSTKKSTWTQSEPADTRQEGKNVIQ